MKHTIETDQLYTAEHPDEMIEVTLDGRLMSMTVEADPDMGYVEYYLEGDDGRLHAVEVCPYPFGSRIDAVEWELARVRSWGRVTVRYVPNVYHSLSTPGQNAP